MRILTALLLFVSSFLFPRYAEAHLALLLQEAIGGAGETTSAGHAAIYLSNVCGNEIAGLRDCRPGEPGIVIASYPDFGLAQSYEWMAVPLPYYLYGVPDEKSIPLYSNGRIRTLLRNDYRKNFLQGDLDASLTDQPHPTRWNQMIGAVYNRDVYAFTVATTKDEDLRFIEAFNQRPNVSHFSTMYANCADFAMAVINTYFPGTVHRDYLNDFTMSTPKAVARQLTLRFARKHPERSLTVQKFSQVPGPIKRSFDNRNFSEEAFRSRKYLITEAILNQELLGVFVASYYLTARFDVNAQHKLLCTRRLTEMRSLDELPRSVFPLARFTNHFTDTANDGTGMLLASARNDRANTFADKKVWGEYRAEFASIAEKAIANRYFLDKHEVASFFRDLELQSDPEFSSDGLRLRVNSYGRDTEVGITPTNILSVGSDKMLAYKLLLAVVRADLYSGEKNRNPIDVFQANWALLIAAAKQNNQLAPAYCQRRFLETPVKVPFKKKLLKGFLVITH